MKFRLLERRQFLLPTVYGWLLLASVIGGFGLAWWFGAEAFLSQNEPIPADILVLEAWTGPGGAAAAAAEFRRPGTSYSYIVAAGGLSGGIWTKNRWSYAEVAMRDLRLQGIPVDRILAAQTKDVASQRTFETAWAARHSLEALGIRPKAVNVLTFGAHARRSRMVFSKVFAPDIPVGVISWTPAGYLDIRWWQSSVRADSLIKETIGYLYELLLNSGRHSNSQTKSREAGNRPVPTYGNGGYFLSRSTMRRWAPIS